MTTIETHLPKSWREIPADQVLKLAGILREPGTQTGFLLKAFLIITGIRPLKRDPVILDNRLMHWFRKGKQEFILNNGQLAEAAGKLTFLLDDPKIPVPEWNGSRFWFTPPMFGLYNMTVEQYLNCENNFAAFSATGDEKHMIKLSLNLWLPKRFTRHPEDRIAKLGDDVKSAITLFYTGSRYYLADNFPNLFSKSSGEGSGDVTQLIRTLNGGDVTRNEAILKVQLWDALKQLEDMAIQAERSKNANKK